MIPKRWSIGKKGKEESNIRRKTNFKFDCSPSWEMDF